MMLESELLPLLKHLKFVQKLTYGFGLRLSNDIHILMLITGIIFT